MNKSFSITLCLTALTGASQTVYPAEANNISFPVIDSALPHTQLNLQPHKPSSRRPNLVCPMIQRSPSGPTLGNPTPQPPALLRPTGLLRRSRHNKSSRVPSANSAPQESAQGSSIAQFSQQFSQMLRQEEPAVIRARQIQMLKEEEQTVTQNESPTCYLSEQDSQQLQSNKQLGTIFQFMQDSPKRNAPPAASPLV